MVMNGISQAAKLNLHESIFSFLEIAIENVRKKGLLRQLNDVLDNLYVHDALTGMYNRFGYERFAQQTYEAFLREDGGAQILFVDMDDMKGINDRYGHEVGDAAIRAAAGLIKQTCRAGDFMMRYGGDEFLVIASIRETGLADALACTLEPNTREDLPCRLSLTVGRVEVDDATTQTLDECVQDADARMYEIKKRKKAGH
jgi:diguanylate cyclase (GGDEF)-like protein